MAVADVFISYKREDRDRIAPLAHALEAHGYTVWWDLELVAGQKWAKQIKTELDAAKCVIVAWTRISVADDRTYASEFVENEADEALRRGVLVPALMDPGCVAWTHQKVQYPSLIDWKGDPEHAGLAALIAGVVQHAGPRATPEELELEAWSAAECAETAEAFRDFVNTYPHSRFVSIARGRAEELDEAAAWTKLGDEPRVTDVREFLRHHPTGRFAETAAAKIETLEREEREQQETEEAERVRLEELKAEHEAREKRARQEEVEHARLEKQTAPERRPEGQATPPLVHEAAGQRTIEELRLFSRQTPPTNHKHRARFAVVAAVAAVAVAIFMIVMPSGHRAGNSGADSSLSAELRPSSPPTSSSDLEFFDLGVERDYDGATPILLVTGEVRNTSNVEMMVPPVRLSLREADSREVLQLTRTISERPLAAGTGVPFQFRVENPPSEAVDVEVNFESPASEQVPSQPVDFLLLEQAALEGNLIAQYELAIQRISIGRTTEGVAMLRSVADRGFPMAQYRLAKLYERGEGVPVDLSVARQWTEFAAENGNRRAMHDLGVYLARGEGGPRDETVAAHWFRQAAELGVADSEFNLGILYQQGRGVDSNPNEALFWFLVAARQGDRDAAARAAELEADRLPAQVEQARSRAETFRPRAANAMANGEFGPRPWVIAVHPRP
jgi:TPR repeat protein